MKRQIITIDSGKCDGCGLCVSACHEGAIGLVDGKATLLRDDYCDGLGNCLPACPTGAITFEVREAAAFDEEAVMKNKAEGATKEGSGAKKATDAPKASFAPLGGCPGSAARSFDRPQAGGAAPRTVAYAGGGCPGSSPRTLQGASAPRPSGTIPANRARAAESESPVSELRQWPVQIKLVPVKAPYFDGADLLIAADCSAYAYASFHEDFIRGKITVIGCPKLDEGDYAEKLTAIIAQNDIRSVTVVRMEVPCCGGLSHAATEALKASGKFIPWQVVTIGTDGQRL